MKLFLIILLYKSIIFANRSFTLFIIADQPVRNRLCSIEQMKINLMVAKNILITQSLEKWEKYVMEKK